MEPSISSPDPFRSLAAQGPDGFNLGEAALLLAAEEYPGLDLPAYLGRLDALAAGAGARVGNRRNSAEVLEELGRYLFEEVGLKGNAEDYYDPENSFLHRVLDRKKGIPITLSVLYLEVGWRLRLPLSGVGLPGHFVVRYEDARWTTFVDPFYGGRLLSEEGCRERVEEIYDGKLAFEDDFLRPISRRDIVVRILSNLKAGYLRREDHARALRYQEKVLLFVPDEPREIRDRGLLLFRIGRFPEARRDLALYLERFPQAEDAALIRVHLQNLEHLVTRLN